MDCSSMLQDEENVQHVMVSFHCILFCLPKTFLEYNTQAQRPTFINKSVISDNLLNGGCDTTAGFLGSF